VGFFWDMLAQLRRSVGDEKGWVEAFEECVRLSPDTESDWKTNELLRLGLARVEGLLLCGRHAVEQRKRRGESKPEMFDFLGFTHVCGSTRKTGRFIVKRHPQTPFSEAQSAGGGASASLAHASRATRAMAALSCPRLVQLPRGAGQHG
jgi:hypothetical protein